MRMACLWVLVALVSMGAARDEQVQFTSEGFLVLDGQPRLILGMYECPKDDAVLKQLAAHGFNLVQAEANRAVLDRLQAQGLHGWVNLGGQLKLGEGDTAAQERLTETVKALKDHPALLCWEGPDEALWMAYFAAYGWLWEEQPKQLGALIAQAAAKQDPKAAQYQQMLEKAIDYTQRSMWPECGELYDTLWRELAGKNPQPELLPAARLQAAQELGDQLTRGWQCVRQLDRRHVFWQNHAPGNSSVDLQRYNQAVDAAGCDIYPAPGTMGVRHGSSLKDTDLTAVGLATEVMRAGAPGKASWMVLQGFGWCDLKGDPFNPTDPVHGRRPNLQETRFMAYDALLHGANAILYWGTYTIEKDSELWKDLLKTGQELRALEPALVSPKAATQPVVVAETNYTSFSGGDPKLALHQVGDDWVLLAVNEWRWGVAFEVQKLPTALEGKTLYRLGSDEEHRVQKGGFRDGIRGHDVQVYATSRRFQVK